MAAPELIDVVTIRVDRFKRWMPQLVRAIATVGDVSPEALIGPGRTKDLAILRQAIVLAARDVLNKSYPDVGHGLGGRDHATILHAYRRAQERWESDGEFRQLATVALAIARTISQRQLFAIEIEPELPL